MLCPYIVSCSTHSNRATIVGSLFRKRHSAVRHSAVRHSAVRHSTVRHSTVRHCAVDLKVFYLAALSFVVFSLMSSATAAPSGKGRVQIDDTYHEVTWSDGDSFRITSGRMRGQRVRLLGYNTLESYGPVHKWGEWNEWALYRLAKDAKQVATRETWECKSLDIKDRYSRLLVRCPKLIEAMINTGMGHVFEVEAKPEVKLLMLQADAIKRRVGMWSRGAPTGLLTSIHSHDEKPGQPAYNRVASLKTGEAKKLLHSNTYKACEWVCAQGSCLLYVPYQQRYGDDRPKCLRWKR